MRRVWAVARKELRQVRRDRRTLVILVFVPAFFLFLYGYALNFDIRNVALAVEDRDASAESRRLVAAFAESAYFQVVATPRSAAAIDALVDRRTARVALVIPEGFAAELQAGGTPAVQVILDGDNANSATTVLGYVRGVLRGASAGVAADGLPAAVVEPRIWYNPELRSTLFLVPGLIAFIAMITAVVSTALSVVREKESGTIEQIRMAPTSMATFIVGKTLPYLFLSGLGAALIILASMVFFDMPMRGSWLALGVVVGVFLIGALGTGLLISTVAETQEVAFQAASLVALLPTVILSGFIFPIASMPVALQYVTVLVPARYFLVALRGIVLKGLALPQVLEPLAALAVYALVVLGLAAVRLGRS